MSLRKKIFAALGVAFVVMAAAQYLAARIFVLGSFERLEEEQVSLNVDRVKNALNEEIAALRATGGDWAAWDDTRDFVLGKKADYAAANLAASSLATIRVNFMVFFDKTGKVVHSAGVDLDGISERPVPAPVIKDALAHSDFFRHSGPEDAKAGLLLLGGVPAMIAVWPISCGERKAPLNGTVVMGRYFDKNAIAALAKRTATSLRFVLADDPKMPTDFASLTAELGPNAAPVIRVLSEQSIAGYSAQTDYRGKPSFFLRIDVPRDIHRHGMASVRYFASTFLAISAILLVALFALLQMLILGPVTRLTAHSALIGRTGDLSRRIGLRSKDEIGVLAREFDAMVANVADARNRLLEQSYYSGLAEMASNVLHNVRNSLMPVVGRCEALRQKFQAAAPERLGQALEELERGEAAAERRESLEKYVRFSGRRFADLIEEGDQDIREIVSGMAGVEKILNEQDQFSHAGRALEPLRVPDVVGVAVEAIPPALRAAADVELEPGLERLPAVLAERVTLAQILGIVLNNAAEAVARGGGARGCVRVAGAAEVTNGLPRIHLRVTDNGCGIAPEAIGRLFERGSSSNGNKPSNLGLHWSANVLAAMNGDIRAESSGLGQGACFHIRLPVAEGVEN